MRNIGNWVIDGDDGDSVDLGKGMWNGMWRYDANESTFITCLTCYAVTLAKTIGNLFPLTIITFR